MKRATANQYLSKYILLRDSFPSDRDVVVCCTCGRLVSRFSNKSHAGHFIPKGMGGSSGVYYDERNCHAQGFSCNITLEGNRTEYWPFMEKKYGREVIEELRRKHRLPRRHSITEYGIMYREKYKELLKEFGLKR
ncbi:hypothetical protein LCGC14_2132550 [marine sediment metagenome]|uniref:Uncharacterized protein n=1 Tax=marine sediment metagenome TaxID=412755 RepID=A0A0F9GWZ2_9ZZZZ